MPTDRPGFLFNNGGRVFIATFGRTQHPIYRLDVAGADVNDGALVIQWEPIKAARQQQWIIDPCGDGEVRIWAGHSGRCLDIVGGEGAGSRVQVTPWKVPDAEFPEGFTNQRWKIQEQKDGSVVIASARTGLVLDVMGDNNPGVSVGVQKPLNGANQRFVLEPVPADEQS